MAKIESIEATIDPQGLCESSRSARQVPQALAVAIHLHDRDAFAWFERPDEDPGADAGLFARDIQHVGAAVSEIDIRVSALEEQRTIARGHASIGVPGGIADHIGFGLDNATA